MCNINVHSHHLVKRLYYIVQCTSATEIEIPAHPAPSQAVRSNLIETKRNERRKTLTDYTNVSARPAANNDKVM